jgi:predicted enzyme related to lactoylglutathione lyase
MTAVRGFNHGSVQMNEDQSAFVATSLAASLTAEDLEASVAWYREVLGFTIDRRFERDGISFAVRVRAGAVALLLTQDNGAKGSDRAKGAGISLRLTTAQDIDALAAQVKARGGALDAEPTSGPGGRVFRLCDPDGFRLVISSEP